MPAIGPESGDPPILVSCLIEALAVYSLLS